MIPRGSETILIIDDDRPLLDLMSRMLASLGYRVMTAEDGATGLDILVSQEKKQLALPDMVLLDMMMSDSGLSSRDVLRQLRGRYASVRVVVTSGHHDDAMVSEVLGTHPDGFLPKPFALRDLARVTRLALDGG